MTRTEAYLVLNSLRLVGPVRVRKLRQVFGSVEGLFSQPTMRLAGVEGVGQAVAESIRGWEKTFDLAAELEKIRKHRLQVIDCEDSDYRDWETDRKSTRLNSSHSRASRMPSSA